MNRHYAIVFEQVFNVPVLLFVCIFAYAKW